MSGRDVVRQMRDSGALSKPARSGNAVDIILGIVATIAVGSCIYVGIDWLNATPPPAAAASPAVLTAARSDIPLWTVEDAAGCERAARAAAREPVPMEFGLANPTLTEGGYARLATLVSCRATRKIERLCDPQQRAEFVGVVNDYLSRREIIIAGLNLEGAPMAIMGGIMGGEVAFGSGMHDVMKDETIGYLDIYHNRVIKALQALARRSLVTESDFGAFFGMGVSGTITEAFKDITANGSGCA